VNAKASTITYTESATVTGFLGAHSFTDALLTLTGTGDTTTIANPTAGLFLNPLEIVLFSVAGVGSGLFQDAIDVISDQLTPATVRFEDFAAGSNILGTANAAFATYDLSTSIGPITGTGFFGTGLFQTSAGVLFLISAGSSSTFTASTVSAVPIPPALPLFATGLVGLLLLGCRRKKKAAAV
jgi:hypothetical protein